MGEKDSALFDEKVRKVIRNCAIVFAPMWIPVLGALGWWLVDLNANVGYNTKSLAKVEVKIDYLVNDVKSKK